MKEWPLGRDAASVDCLHVIRKINIGMMIFVAAIFNENEKEECPLQTFFCVLVFADGKAFVA